MEREKGRVRDNFHVPVTEENTCIWLEYNQFIVETLQFYVGRIVDQFHNFEFRAQRIPGRAERAITRSSSNSLLLTQVERTVG